jgi:hypothetical protein
MSSTLANQMPVPPVDMVMPAINTVVAIANFVLLGIVTVFIAREARRTRSWIPLLTCLRRYVPQCRLHTIEGLARVIRIVSARQG